MKADRIHFMSRRSASRMGILLAATLGMLSIVTQGQAIVTRTLTINANGTISGQDWDGTIISSLGYETTDYDIGPAGSPNVIHNVKIYFAPWSVTQGDVFINTECATCGVIRFLQDSMFPQLDASGVKQHGIIFFTDPTVVSILKSEFLLGQHPVYQSNGQTINPWYTYGPIISDTGVWQYEATGDFPYLPGTGGPIPYQKVDYTFIAVCPDTGSPLLLMGIALAGLVGAWKYVGRSGAAALLPVLSRHQ